MSSKHNNPQFSIIVPMRNGEKTIKDALDSVKNQNFNDFEILVIDDNSSDNSKQVVKDYMAKYPNMPIKLLDVYDGETGSGAGRNVGLDNAKGEWILYLDQDDELYDEKSLYNINDSIKKNNYAEVLIMSYLRKGYDLKGNNTTNIKVRHDLPIEKSKAYQIAGQFDGAIWYGCWNRKLFNTTDGRKRRFKTGQLFDDVIMRTELFANVNKKAIALAKHNDNSPIYGYIWKNRPNMGVVNRMEPLNLKELLNAYRAILNLAKE